jgi:hypothetical protein
VLERAVEHHWLTAEQGYRIGESVLGANAFRLHGLSPERHTTALGCVLVRLGSAQVDDAYDG